MSGKTKSIHEIAQEFTGLRAAGEVDKNFDQLIDLASQIFDGCKNADFATVACVLEAVVRKERDHLAHLERNLVDIASEKIETANEVQRLLEIHPRVHDHLKERLLEAAVKVSRGKEEVVDWLVTLGYVRREHV